MDTKGKFCANKRRHLLQNVEQGFAMLSSKAVMRIIIEVRNGK